MNALTALSDSESIRLLLRDVDSRHLARELAVISATADASISAARLRIAALISMAQVLDEDRVDLLLRDVVQDKDPEWERTVLFLFRKWAGFVDSLLDSNQLPMVEDLLLFAAAGLLADRPTDVRALLRRPEILRLMDSELVESTQKAWPNRVRDHISLALLLLIRQQSRDDILKAGSLIEEIASDQKQIESTWLDDHETRRDAMLLLGLYHLAESVVRLSEFLLTGSVEDDEGELVSDFAPELGRLLTRAEEYLSLSVDLEARSWLNASILILLRLRSNSIWVTGRNISRRIDQLLDEITKEGRQSPVFSLLPSQRDAIYKSLLDPVRIAVILQMPTSSGKTLLAEFAILQTFENFRDTVRVAYVVPTRALATQVRRTLSEDLRPLNIQISSAGSAFEDDPYELNLLNADDSVVVTTPEKLDLLLRAHSDWFRSLRLVIVDEAHLMGDQGSDRGVRLELLLANIRREQPQTRLLLLTPFVGNGSQLANWLGGPRGLSVEVHWRPSRILLGLASISGSGARRTLKVEWSDPYDPYQAGEAPSPLMVHTNVAFAEVGSVSKRITFLAERFRHMGTVLGMFSNSPAAAEDAAAAVSGGREPLVRQRSTPALRLAIAIARSEYGDSSVLARCLECGVAFHHSALSPMLRYLIEDQVRQGTINFIAATTTLAQGMNFPVAVVLVHSVAKPYGKGDLTPSEFWNIAGRAGRVGLTDKGIVLFANSDHRDKWSEYSAHLTSNLRSALLHVLKATQSLDSLKLAYDRFPEIRPFLQYLNHAASDGSPATALRRLEELLQGSLANTQAASASDARDLRTVARSYLQSIQNQPTGYLKVVDTTGLGSYSFDELFGKIGNDSLLMGGPGAVLGARQEGLTHLIRALKWLPELDLAIGKGEGSMDEDAVAAVVQGWIDGKQVFELSSEFPGKNDDDKVRHAATYVYRKVSQSISWGAHAYLRGWLMRKRSDQPALSDGDRMLPAFIQYGVNSPEASVVSLLGMPRQFAEPFAGMFRDRFGTLVPENALALKNFVEEADHRTWHEVIERSSLASSVDARDVRAVWRQMQGLK